MLNKSVVELLVLSVYLLVSLQTTIIIKITSGQVARIVTIQALIRRRETLKRASRTKRLKDIETNK